MAEQTQSDCLACEVAKLRRANAIAKVSETIPNPRYVAATTKTLTKAQQVKDWKKRLALVAAGEMDSYVPPTPPKASGKFTVPVMHRSIPAMQVGEKKIRFSIPATLPNPNYERDLATAWQMPTLCTDHAAVIALRQANEAARLRAIRDTELADVRLVRDLSADNAKRKGEQPKDMSATVFTL